MQTAKKKKKKEGRRQRNWLTAQSLVEGASKEEWGVKKGEGGGQNSEGRVADNFFSRPWEQQDRTACFSRSPSLRKMSDGASQSAGAGAECWRSCWNDPPLTWSGALKGLCREWRR